MFLLYNFKANYKLDLLVSIYLLKYYLKEGFVWIIKKLELLLKKKE